MRSWRETVRSGRATRANRPPTLILWGEKDKLRGPPAARIFTSRIPGSKLVIYPGVGHIPMEETPERSATDAIEFLKTNG